MCGIAGLIGRPSGDRSSLINLTKRMTDSISHRGPDGEGHWLDAQSPVALGHRRLAIIDLSPTGVQPMVSHSGRFTIVFNGEIFNYREIRTSLLREAATSFHGSSDTEVMLAAFEFWGIERAVRTFVGMFAFAVWDRDTRLLHLGRDRLGIKSIYYGMTPLGFAFGSELKALRALPGFSPSINLEALGLYFKYHDVPTPWTIYQGVSKLEAGTLLTVDVTGQVITKSAYWTLVDAISRAKDDPFGGSFDEAVIALQTRIDDAVRLRMISDVPIGAFLSGGIDSTTVVAAMQQHSTTKIKTFTIGFAEEQFNEAPYAKAVADHLKTDHLELRVSHDDALAVVPRLADMYDEPFADSSQIPTYLVNHMARQHVTVALSGDGGDELFAGYNRYAWGPQLYQRLALQPGTIKSFMARALGSPVAKKIFAEGALLPRVLKIAQPEYKLQKGLHAMSARNEADFFDRIISFWPESDFPLIADQIPSLRSRFTSALPHFTERMMQWDQYNYMADDILAKVDRASMATSLEARVPLLDHRLVEFAWSLPLSYKLSGRTGKHILREALYKRVPKALLERPKVGFALPLDQWLRGPLRSWATDMLSADRLKRQGILSPTPIIRALEEHLSGKRNRHEQIWSVLMFQAWHDRWIKS